MSSKLLTLVVADQLFQDHPAFDSESDFVMVESGFLTSHLNYHKFKLTYILASMREYRDYLESKSLKVHYSNLNDNLNNQVDFESILQYLFTKHGYQELQICTIADKYFAKHLTQICTKLSIKLTILPSKMFLTPSDTFKEFVDSKKGKRLQMSDFYIQQRRRLGIMVDSEANPEGGKWSFDEDNRKKIPKSIQIPTRTIAFDSKHYLEVRELIESKFPNNPGQTPTDSWLPLNSKQAREYLEEFCNNFYSNFGDYEDALTTRSDLVFHSCLSTLLNNGLLTPEQVLNRVLNQDNIPINSKEGFVRQIIGWREWVKGLYDHVYKDNYLEMNFFEARENLPEYFYSCDQNATENNLPLKLVLDKINRLAYCHHIERLMVFANWMLLSEYSPAQCYKWFVEMFVDSSEWVMVANVMGMGLYADGGIFATKPYVAGGNYLKKMSDYPNGKGASDWEKLWTDKFWHFVLKHEKVFLSNPRMNMLIKTKKNKSKLD
jgi:deoxyribodipyrimidine photolyase-related protein